MEAFGRFYLDKEKDLVVDLFREGDGRLTRHVFCKGVPADDPIQLAGIERIQSDQTGQGT